ncbi:MAG: hypothetical protein OXQ92_16410 [Boseongicola sp.]|nr:hypothetical protein [Boseongicola sp.]MDD9977653.1 hypothetical protein [Boseongicola sp.]
MTALFEISVLVAPFVPIASALVIVIAAKLRDEPVELEIDGENIVGSSAVA